MAVIDTDYKKWAEEFEAQLPHLFAPKNPLGPQSTTVALRRDLMRIAFLAGKCSARNSGISSVLANSLGDMICAAEVLLNRIVETRGAACVDNMEFAINGARAAIKKYEDAP